MSSEYLTLPIYLFICTLSTALLLSKKYRFVADFLLLIAVFYLGWQISIQPDIHYNKNTLYLLRCRCEEQLSHNNYILSSQRQRFYLNHFYINTNYSPGDSLIFHARISPVFQNANPGEFDFAQYLKQKTVYHQVIPCTEIQQRGHSHTIGSLFNHFREKLLKKTDRLTRDSLCRQLINALCLGDKTDLNPEFQNLFVRTGTIHLLSVSGLHTGAIFLLLIFIFKHIGLPRKISALSVIPLLWAYACLTGFSPSSVRASTILSFITLGKVFCRTYTPLNSLAASAFFTLLLRPSTLYSLSFLLSYSAYTGILILYPLLYQSTTSLPKLLSPVYASCCLSISAQLPTLPLTAFYFHTINISGFLVNIIAIPLATLFLYSSAFCLLLPNVISQYLIYIPELLSRLFVLLLKTLVPYSLNFQDLYPTFTTVILIYVCLFTFGGYLLQRKCFWYYVHIMGLILLLSNLIVTNLYLSSQTKLVIFHHNRNSSILINYKGYYTFLIHTLSSSGKTLPYVLQNKLKSLPPGNAPIAPLLWWQKPYLYWKEDTILIATPSTPINAAANILILTQNVRPHHLFTGSETQEYPRLIIADGSNRTSTLLEWARFCECHHIAFRNTSEIGSVSLPLK